MRGTATVTATATATITARHCHWHCHWQPFCWRTAESISDQSVAAAQCVAPQQTSYPVARVPSRAHLFEMGYDSDFWLSIGCCIPLRAENWSKMRRVCANPKLQKAIFQGGDSVLYPSRAKSEASASATEPVAAAAASTSSVAESAGAGCAELEQAAASHALDDAHAPSDSESDDGERLDADLNVRIVSDDRYGTPASYLLHQNCARNAKMNAMLRDFFSALPGFDTDDGAPLTAAEHKAALAEFERRFTENADATALIFEFRLLRQSISAKCENFETEKHMSAGELGELMASGERLLMSYGFALSDIHVRSSMRCG